MSPPEGPVISAPDPGQFEVSHSQQIAVLRQPVKQGKFRRVKNQLVSVEGEISLRASIGRVNGGKTLVEIVVKRAQKHQVRVILQAFGCQVRVFLVGAIGGHAHVNHFGVPW